MAIKTEYFPVIDWLKAFAIILIVITHSLTWKERLSMGGPFWIDMAVPVFMILSGFTYSLSAEHRNIYSFNKWFSLNLILPKLKRILVAYGVAMIVETILFAVLQPELIGGLIKRYLFGGWGPGSYYVPILLQLLLVFPVLFFIFNKSPIAAIIISFGGHLCFDVLANLIPISESVYRLLIFRYLAFVFLGIILYYYKDRLIEALYGYVLFFGALSAGYIYIYAYIGYTLTIFAKWTSTSLPTAFWAFFLVVSSFKYLRVAILVDNIVKIIGRASYHIFLVQMIYFMLIAKMFESNVIINLAICMVIGIIFYYFEMRVLRNAFRR